jgi:hypothetical protein
MFRAMRSKPGIAILLHQSFFVPEVSPGVVDQRVRRLALEALSGGIVDGRLQLVDQVTSLRCWLSMDSMPTL